MKWYKHISDSLDDPFIFDLVDHFGGDGYLVFFGVLEIYAREYKPEPGWKLKVTRGYLRQKLHKRQDTIIIKCLKYIGSHGRVSNEFTASLPRVPVLNPNSTQTPSELVNNSIEIFQNSGKWDINFNSTHITVYIPKFTELLDDWTSRLLRSSSVVAPKKPVLDKEEDKDNKDSVPSPLCPHKEIISLYHECLPELARVKEWNDTRKKLLRKRWKDDPKRQNLEWWKGYFEYVKESPFLMGDKKEFQADLEWLIKPNNFAKVIEGKYHNHK